MQTRAFVTRIRPLFHAATLPLLHPPFHRVPRPPTTSLPLSLSPTFNPLLFLIQRHRSPLSRVRCRLSLPLPFGLNGTGETNRAALLFSDSSGTVRSVGEGIRCIRARPISTRGFNSVFEGVFETRERSEGGERRGWGSITKRGTLFKINTCAKVFDTTLETRYVVVYNEN